MAKAINDAICQEMRRDPTVILLGEDVAGGAGLTHLKGEDAWGGPLGVTKGIGAEFGRGRVWDTPISESAFIGTAIGAAATGLRPIVELMFVDFLGVCFDQIYNQGAKMRYMFGGRARVPLVIRTMIGGGLGAAAQHSGCLYSLFTHFPGLKTVVPSTPYDAKGLLISSIRDDDLVIFFEHKAMYGMTGAVPDEPYTVPLGKAEIKRQGSDVTAVGIAKTVHTCLEAAELLEKEGISLEVIDLRSLSPMDEETILTSVAKTQRFVAVDEANPRCGMAADLAALVATKAFDRLVAPIRMVTAPHTPVPFSPVLEQFYLPSAEKVVEAVRSIVKK
jgi:pyruvate dehydrogenase E1 component beta subunit